MSEPDCSQQAYAEEKHDYECRRERAMSDYDLTDPYDMWAKKCESLKAQLAEAMSLLKEIDDSGEINDNVWGTRLDLIYAKHKEHKP